MKGRSRIANIILKAYSKRYNLRPEGATAVPVTYPSEVIVDKSFRYNRFLAFVTRNTILISLALLATLLAIMAVHYYNLLVDSQQNLLAAEGNVNALLQRRNDIANNLSKAVLDYSTHERGVFTSVVSLRSFMSKNQTGKEEYLKSLSEAFEQQSPFVPSEGGTLQETEDKNLLSSLSKLMALAEQYPNLKLSTNFESLMTALIEVEKDLAAERIKFNDAANIYTTNVAKFPCNIFAFLYRFPRSPYFKATQDAKDFKLIRY